MLGRTILLALIVGCGGHAPRPVEQDHPRSPATSKEQSDLRIRDASTRDGAVDATFDQEARGGNPTWAPSRVVEGGIRVTLHSLTREARLCFAGLLDSTVDVTVTVAPDGRASDIVVETPHSHARECLADAIGGAVFPLSRRAWRVDYVFRL